MFGEFPARFARTVDLYGEAGFARVRHGGAVVVGLGGVGAHCVTALARSGLGHVKLIDDDRISVTSLNRHPVAMPIDVGRLKTEVLAAWIARACPDTRVEAVAARVGPDSLADLVCESERELFPVLIDCIDSVEAKTSLIAHGVRHGWHVLSSQGAAGKRDGGLVRTGDLMASEVCPLARAMRLRLRKAGIVPGQVTAVWSEELPAPSILTEPGADLDVTVLHRRQPSNAMVPGIFGFALAAAAIALLAAGGALPSNAGARRGGRE